MFRFQIFFFLFLALFPALKVQGVVGASENCILSIHNSSSALSEPKSPNYDESKVPNYNLPSALTLMNGQKVRTSADWAVRRREIVQLFSEHVYGFVPQQNIKISYSKIPSNHALPMSLQRLNASIEEVSMNFSKNGSIKRSAPFMMILPENKSTKPVPALLFINFGSNQNMIDTWATTDVLKRGHAIIYVNYEDIEPDSIRGLTSSRGIRSLYLNEEVGQLQENQWGAIGAWAFGASRILDYLISSEPRIDKNKIAIGGLSRLGKTALWAAAQDERFAMALSVSSGAVGAALSRRAFGETVHKINHQFPHWFNGNFKAYNENENILPVDQHMLIASIAPRPVYITSAVEDQWADPKGEFLSVKHADEVYDFLGVSGLRGESWSDIEIDKPVGDNLRYHIRSGIHQVTPFDWNKFQDYMKDKLL